MTPIFLTILQANAGDVEKYGPLATIVQGAGFLLAAAFALSLGWMKRAGSKWIPPEEALPKSTTRVASLISAVMLCFIFVFLRNPDRSIVLALTTVFFLIVCVTALLITVFIIRKYGFESSEKDKKGSTVTITKLGGSEYTHDAKQAVKVRNVTPDRLFEESHRDIKLIYTKASIAKIHTLVSATFIVFQSSGTLALGGAGLLLSMA